MSVGTIPVRELIKDLSTQFRNATKGYPDAVRGNATYKHQSEFAWYINEISQGPACMVYEHVNGCREYIKNIKRVS